MGGSRRRKALEGDAGRKSAEREDSRRTRASGESVGERTDASRLIQVRMRGVGGGGGG